MYVCMYVYDENFDATCGYEFDRCCCSNRTRHQLLSKLFIDIVGTYCTFIAKEKTRILNIFEIWSIFGLFH